MGQHDGRSGLLDVLTAIFGAAAIFTAFVAALVVGAILVGPAVTAVLSLFAR